MGIFPLTRIFGHKILVTGSPGFGKSVLCSFLAARWASSQAPMNQFDLCLNFSLDELNLAEINLFESINLCCKQWLRGEAQLEAILKRHTYRIIFVLDSFDKISIQKRKAVRECLKSDARFQHCTVLLTSRTSQLESSDRVFNLFNSVLRIVGFSYERLEKLWCQTVKSKKPLSRKLFWRLEFLTGLSPFFTLLIWRASMIVNTEDEVKLFDLLELVMHFLADSLRIDNEVGNRLYLKLGKLCYEALVNGYSLFSEELLRRVLGNDFDIFLRTFIFWKPRSPHEISVWHAASKVIVQYLATRYLRCNWNRRKNQRSQKDFVKNVFCLGICECGDYVTGREGTEQAVYQVGLIPDFVLKYSFLKYLDLHMLRSVEMLQDTEDCILKSPVFESCNLLLRTNTERLGRFSFVLHRSDEDSICSCAIDQCFHSVLNRLCFDECVVDHCIYSNKFENKHFLKVLVSKSEEDIVMCGVFRAKNNLILDKVIIQFSVSDYGLVLQGLVPLLAECLPECDIQSLSGCKNFKTFVHSAILNIFEGRSNKWVFFECSRNVDVTDVEDIKKVRTLEVSIEPKTNGTIMVEQRGLIPSEQKAIHYDPLQFQKLFNSFSKDNCDYTVTVKILG